MAITKKEAQAAIQRTLSGYQAVQRTRVAFLGDGRGRAASNMIVNENKARVFARDELNSKDHFTVLNEGRVNPKFDLPVIIGEDPADPNVWRILSIHYASYEFTDNASVAGGMGAHHDQHEFGGGDEVFIDGRLFKPGLLQPTVLPSMQASVLPFVYYNNGWRRFGGGKTVDFTTNKPVGDFYNWVLITLDPTTASLSYVYSGPKITLSNFTWTEWLGGLSVRAETLAGTPQFEEIPKPAATHIPLGAVLLTASTTAIDWNVNAASNNNLFDARLHIGAPQDNLIDRLEAVDMSTGNDSNMPVMGVANHGSSLDYWEIIDLGYF